MSSSKSLTPVKGKVKLYSTSVLCKGKTKKEVISLQYFLPGEEKGIHVDINSFRPDPVDYLSSDKMYNAELYFDEILVPCDARQTKNMVKEEGEKIPWSKIKILRSVKVGAIQGEKFVNIR